MKNDFNQIIAAGSALANGGIIAYPTEAVWGIGCDPYNEAAVLNILRIKDRSIHKGLILVSSNISQFDQLLEPIDAVMRDKLESSWPGPTTWVIEDHNNIVPSWIKGAFSSVAVRVSAHPVIKDLCQHFGSPIVSTSLNPAGYPPALNAMQAIEYFPNEIDFLVDGELGGSSDPSCIISLHSGQVFR